MKRRVRWPTLRATSPMAGFHPMGRKKLLETEAGRLERIERLEAEMERWLAHMGRLKKRREAEADRQNPNRPTTTEW